MSKSVLSRPSVSLHHGRSASDLSEMHNFNQSAGMFVPIYWKPLIAGSKGKISRKAFTRTKQVLYPAFNQCQQHIDVFLVPMRSLLSHWNDWKLNINDIGSTANVGWTSNDTDLSLKTMIPRINLNHATWLNYLSHNAQYGTGYAIQRATESARLFDHLGYGDFYPISANNLVNLFPLCAYQRVYYDYFRNTSYEQNDPYAYNLDWIYNDAVNGLFTLTGGNASKHDIIFSKIARMRYRNYRNDYFHNIYPSLNYVSGGGLGQPSGKEWLIPSTVQQLTASTNFLTAAPSGPAVASNGSVYTGSSAHYDGSGTTLHGVTVQSIRAAFALDKLMRASAYAPKHVREQFKARFGVDVGKNAECGSERIGSFINDITFGEVTQVVNTLNSGTNLGDVGGKGIGSSIDKDSFDFYAKEDSILIAIQSFVPRAMYDSIGLFDWNMKLEREDFYQPEFENLGLRPLYRKHLDLSNSLPNSIMGYTVPNQCYKLGIDLNHGLFRENYPSWSYDSGTSSFIETDTNTSPLSAFTQHNQGQLMTGVTAEYFKIRPTDLDWIFEQNFDGSDMSTDQFFGICKIQCAITHNMSIHGQPSL